MPSSSASICRAKLYKDISCNVQRKWFAQLMSRVTIPPGSKVVDLGCGTGDNTVTLANLVGDEGHVTGIDPDGDRIKFAVANNKENNIDYVLGKGSQIPTIEEGYDFIVSNAVMHWVGHVEKRETYRRVLDALKPGGIFASCECATRSQYYDRCSAFLTQDEQDHLDTFYFLTVDENVKLFTDLGFECVDIEQVVEEDTFASVNSYLEWLFASLHGKVDIASIRENKEKIGFELKEDGSLTSRMYLNNIIVKRT